MFEKFGEMSSAEEINELAENLCNEGDVSSLRELAKENGIDVEMADLYLEGMIPALVDAESAALGKLDVEVADLKPKEIMHDWVEYIRSQVFEDPAIARAVRKEGKSLKGCIGALLKWSFGHQQEIDNEIIKAAGVGAKRVTLGIPGMGNAKTLIRRYYLEEKTA